MLTSPSAEKGSTPGVIGSVIRTFTGTPLLACVISCFWSNLGDVRRTTAVMGQLS